MIRSDFLAPILSIGPNQLKRAVTKCRIGKKLMINLYLTDLRLLEAMQRVLTAKQRRLFQRPQRVITQRQCSQNSCTTQDPITACLLWPRVMSLLITWSKILPRTSRASAVMLTFTKHFKR
jgi:hypothetical protein